MVKSKEILRLNQQQNSRFLKVMSEIGKLGGLPFYLKSLLTLSIRLDHLVNKLPPLKEQNKEGMSK